MVKQYSLKLRQLIRAHVKKQKSVKAQRGFTLLELMIVLVILGGLMSVLFFSLRGSNIDAKKAKIEMGVTFMKVQAALEEFRNQQGRYPSTEEGLNALHTAPPGVTNYTPVLDKKFTVDPWKTPFKYVLEGGRYRLISLGADACEGGEGENADIDLTAM